MELDVRLLKSFLAVAEERSFTRAADRLHIAQPSLSVQIRKLEDQLGFQLFARNRNQTVQTSTDADAFLPFVREYLVAVERIGHNARRIRDRAGATLRLGAPDFSAEMPIRKTIINGFMDRHGNLEIEVANALTVDLLRWLRDGEIDAAFTLGPHADPHSEAMVLARYRLSLLMPRTWRDRYPQPAPLSALTGEKIAFFRRNLNPSFYDSIAPLLEGAGIVIDHLAEPGNAAVIQYALDRMVPVLVGEWSIDSVNLPESLAVLPLAEPALSFNVNLVRRLGDRSPSLEQLWGVALQSIAA